MKKLLSVLVLGAFLAATVLLQSQVAPRGDLYGARALQALEQAFKTTGVLTFPNYAAAPVACNAANLGVYYYDTVLAEARICGAGPAWVAVGAGLTVGTANTIPKWNAVPDDLVDSLITDDGTDLFVGDDVGIVFGATNDADVYWNNATGFSTIVDGTVFSTFDNLQWRVGVTAYNTFWLNDPPAASGSGYTWQFNGNFVNSQMDGGDTQGILEITNSGYTGASAATNNFYAINIEGLTPSANTTELAISIGVGWDVILWADTAVLTLGSDLDYISFLDATLGIPFAFDLEHDPTANHQWQWINATSDIMTGDDLVQRVLWIDLLNANHTNAGGLGNSVYGIDVDGITGDADASEYAIHFGTGWDKNLYADTVLSLQSVQQTQMRVGSNNYLSVSNDAGYLFAIDDRAAQSQVEIWSQLRNNTSMLELKPATQVLMDGSDTERGIFIDLPNANHTGASNFLYGLDIDGITADANALEYGIKVGAGWEAAIYSVGIAHAALVAVANGSMVFCTDCDPATTPCTTIGAQTGAFAFRVNGAWDCPW